MRAWCSKYFVAASAALAGLLSACGTAPVYVGPGGVYANDRGRELFVYRSDARDADRFPCGAECSPAWTPLYAGDVFEYAEGDFSILVRDDGNWQWAYRGQPVYFYSGRMRALGDDPQMKAGLWTPLASISSAAGGGR